MGGRDPSGVLRDFRTLVGDGVLGTLTDKQLLERFAGRDGPSAEEAASRRTKPSREPDRAKRT